MGIEKVVWIKCDYKDCKGGLQGTPTLLTWNETLVNAGRAEAPEESKYLVISSHNGEPRTFCCQLCASNYFLPPGYDTIRKKVETLPVKVVDGPVAQPDGAGPEESPENGLCGCGHPLEIHNSWGCCEVMSNRPGDFCKCSVQGPGENVPVLTRDEFRERE